jgi:cell division protein FtsI/penicillin-binding protein 2
MKLAHTELRKSRVLVAAAGLFLGLALLWLRIGWLAVVRHGHYEARAELHQEQRVLVRPGRGRLLDREGRELARDRTSYGLSAVPAEMKDPRRTAARLARLLDEDARALQRRFAARRYVPLARGVDPATAEAVLGERPEGVHVTTETRREYVLGDAACELLGRTDVDNRGLDGLELQLDRALGGRPGWTTLFRDALGRSHSLPRGLRRRPEHGSDVTLTLDLDLQAILEQHLTRAVDTLRAVRGFAIFIDPRTGGILASANVPHLPPGRARNWSFTDQYEPGSTFKAVVAGAVLEEGLARPDQVFEAAASGQALIAPGAVFHDTHEEASFRFRDAVRYSSNIVMGRLALLLGPDRLYRYATTLGFGSLTGVEFPGETAGRLRPPSAWSARSCPTIAIGHEVTVTPLQLALAYGAIANGGVLMQPMLVEEVREPSGSVRRFRPHAVRRVFSEATTRTLGEMLQSVVDSGTARAARVPGLRVAGKTGTAQKYDARVGTYGAGMYLSSFVGYAPAEAPAVVGVVVIDEPRGGRYYGGEVAAPVFREVLKDLQRLPRGPFRQARDVAARPPAPAPVTVPDVRLLIARGAESRLAANGLRALTEGEGPRVLAQSPPAGEAVERGGRVTLWLAPPADSAAGVLPDLAGLSLRQALRELTLRRLQARIEGGGVVVRQSPAPGAALPPGASVTLWCAPRPPRTGGEVAALGAAVGGGTAR